MLGFTLKRLPVYSLGNATSSAHNQETVGTAALERTQNQKHARHQSI